MEEDEIAAAFEHVRCLVEDDQPAGGPRIDKEMLGLVRTYAHNAALYLEEMKTAREELRQAREKIAAATSDIDRLNEKLDSYRIRESVHAGMCQAYQNALQEVACGLARGAQK